MRQLHAVLVPLLAVSIAGSALASSNAVPTQFVRRPLTLPGATMRFDGGPRWPEYDAQFKHVVVDDGDDLDFLNPGLSFGLTDNFELGFVVPIQLSPGSGVHNPRVDILYRFEPGPTSYGLFVEVGLPLFPDVPNGDDDFHVLAGVPVFHLFNPSVRLETGGFALIDNIGDDSRLSLIAPISFSFQITDRLYAGPEAGLGLYGVFEDGSGIATPIGGFLGYTLGNTLGDLYGRMRLTDIPDGALELMFGLEFYFDL